MASQRIVLTSPWKLGLFVFLLVVGTGFGLIYASIELFGVSIDLTNQETLEQAYMVLGGVALLALLGYIAVVSSARPLDRVVRGGRKREQLIKKFGQIEDPQDADPDEFEDLPALASVLERWTQDSIAANDAQLTVAQQRELIAGLTAQIQTNDAEGLALAPEQELPELKALVDAFNQHIAQVASRAAVQSEAAALPVTPALDPATEEAIRDLLACETELAGFVRSVAEHAGQLAQQAGGGPAISTAGAADEVRAQAERIVTIRTTLEQLAEEANKLAIGMALQISRLGDAGNEMLDTAESVRSLSVRYQRVAADLRLCENDQANLARSLAGMPTGGESSGSTSPLAMILDQNAEGLREVLGRLRRPLDVLRAAIGHSMTATTAAAKPTPAAPAATQTVSTPAPRAAEAAEGRIYEMAELGGREIAGNAQPGSETVYDLEQFGAVEL